LDFRKGLKLFLLVIFLLSQSLFPSFAQEKRKRVIVFVIDRVTLSEISDPSLPTFKKLIQKGSIALMNNRGYLGIDTSNSFLSLATGERAPSVRGFSLVGERWEIYQNSTVSEVYRLRTGKPPGNSQVFFLNLALVEEALAEVPSEIKFGILGDILKNNGYKRAVLGNEDLGIGYNFEKSRRPGALLALDSEGKADYGAIGREAIKVSPNSPYGVKVDLDSLLDHFKFFYPRSDFLVIDFGDTARADMYAAYAVSLRKKEIKKEALLRADEFLKKLLKIIDLENDTLIILSPSPPLGKRKPVPTFTPIIAVGNGFSSGFLTSSSTKREGIVLNKDFVPTVLSLYRLDAPSFLSGSKMESIESSNKKLDFLIDREKRATFVDTLRGKLVLLFIVFQVFLYLLFLFYLFIHKKMGSFIWLWRLGVLLSTGVPLSFYLFPLFVGDWNFPWRGIFLSFLFVLLLSLASLYFFKKDALSFLPISTLTFIVVLGDVCAKNPLSFDNIFGFSSLIGARFYGLGNEGLAIFLGSFLLSLAIFLEKVERKKWLWPFLVFIFVAALVIIGFPNLGADLGGTITAFCAFAVAFWWLTKRRVNWKFVIVIFLLALFFALFFSSLDFQKGSFQTHLGKTFSLFKSHQWKSLGMTLKRKAETNWRVLKYSSWSYLFGFFFLALIFLNYRPMGWLKSFLQNHQGVSVAFSSALVGGLVGFLTNDSGIVLPALIMSFFLALLFWYLSLDYEEEKVFWQ
jgi:hypothetical protein